jgi:hypothetical protein
MGDGEGKQGSSMPDVPKLDLVGALSEIWFNINYAAYHLAYVKVYLQTAALRVEIQELRKEEQDFKNKTQSDVIICRAHLAALFWQLDHFFEALRAAVNRGKKEQPEEQYFWKYARNLEEIEKTETYQEIDAYRNKSHELPAIIGTHWVDGKFHHHFLPTIAGHAAKENTEMIAELHKYFEFVAGIWLSFAPSDLKDRFPRDFQFTVTIPHSYVGELPAELKNGIRQLEVQLEYAGAKQPN